MSTYPPYERDPSASASEGSSSDTGGQPHRQGQQEHSLPSYTPRNSGGYHPQGSDSSASPPQTSSFSASPSYDDTGYPDLSGLSTSAPAESSPPSSSFGQPSNYETSAYMRGSARSIDPSQQQTGSPSGPHTPHLTSDAYSTPQPSPYPSGPSGNNPTGDPYHRGASSASDYGTQSYEAQGYQNNSADQQPDYAYGATEQYSPVGHNEPSSTTATAAFANQTTTEPFDLSSPAGPVDQQDSPSPDEPSQEPRSALQAAFLAALNQMNTQPRIDSDGDIMFEKDNQVLFVQCTETPFPAMRLFGQWRRDGSVNATFQEQLDACSTVSMDSHFIKVGIVDKVVIVRVDHLVFPGTDINVLLDISIAHIIKAIVAWYQKVS